MSNIFHQKTPLGLPAMLDAGGNAYLADLRKLRECQQSGECPAFGFEVS